MKITDKELESILEDSGFNLQIDYHEKDAYTYMESKNANIDFDLDYNFYEYFFDANDDTCAHIRADIEIHEIDNIILCIGENADEVDLTEKQKRIIFNYFEINNEII